ncbi:GNAT family N-acetyltransferase [Streptomyces sp. NPDC005438]|uniref:GNAT family N-acetyltransferase n=1 Tax=Streptomyces sp. NPDC005438 TaxID=3156880 RepID=UPI0033B62664
MVSLRVISGDSWPLWRDLRLAALTDSPESFVARLADWDEGGEEQWRERLETPGTYNVAALQGDRAVGMVRGVRGTEAGVGELRSLWVSPEVRGLGVADQLVEAVREWAERSGLELLRLAVLPDNSAAVALYRRHGFVPAGEWERPSPEGEGPERLMVRRLGRAAPT